MIQQNKKSKLNNDEINLIKLYTRKSKSCVYRYIHKLNIQKTTISNVEKSKRGRKKTILNSEECSEAVKEFILKEQQSGIIIRSISIIKQYLIERHLIKPSVSLATVRRYAKIWGIYYTNSVVLPKLQDDNKKERIEAVSKNICVNYKKIMFSDESIICLRDIAVKGYTVRGSKLFTPQTIKRNTSIMIWGAFSYYGFTDLEIIDNGKIDSEVYCEILNKHIPNLKARNPNNQSLLLQDNATLHTSIRTSQFINSNGILTIYHPRLSPDLNLIEKVWR